MWNYGCFMASLSAANTEKMEVLVLLSGGGGRCRQTWLPQFKMLPAVQSVRHVMMQRTVLAGQVAGGAEAQDLPSLHHPPPFRHSRRRGTQLATASHSCWEKAKRSSFSTEEIPQNTCFSDCVLLHSMHGQRSSPRHGHGPHPPPLSWGMREHESISRFRPLVHLSFVEIDSYNSAISAIEPIAVFPRSFHNLQQKESSKPWPLDDLRVWGIFCFASFTARHEILSISTLPFSHHSQDCPIQLQLETRSQ